MSALHLNVFVDGYGHELANAYPVLDDLFAHRQSMRSVLGYTNAALPTILSGRLPEEHGRFTLWTSARNDPSPFGRMGWLRLIPARLASYGRVRRRIDRALVRSLGWSGYFSSGNLPPSLIPRLDYSEKRDLYRRGSLAPVANIFDVLDAENTPFWCFDWHRSEAENVSALEARIAEGDLRWAFLGLQSFDGLVHALGTRHPRLEDALRTIRSALERLLLVARDRHEEVHLNVFSDHGLADVTRHVDLRPALAEAGFGKGDGLVLLDATFARFYFESDAVADRLRKALAKISGGRVLESTELRTLGADFPGNRYGDLIFILDEGGMLHPSHASRTPCAGMHGYHPESPSMDALLLSTDAPKRRPETIADLHDLLLLGAVPEPELATPGGAVRP